MQSVSHVTGASLKTPGRRSLVARISGYLSRVRRRAAARRAAIELLEQDDRMLDDMGLTRHDVVSALACSDVTDTTEFLALRRQERRRGRFS